MNPSLTHQSLQLLTVPHGAGLDLRDEDSLAGGETLLVLSRHLRHAVQLQRGADGNLQGSETHLLTVLVFLCNTCSAVKSISQKGRQWQLVRRLSMYSLLSQSSLLSLRWQWVVSSPRL